MSAGSLVYYCVAVTAICLTNPNIILPSFLSHPKTPQQPLRKGTKNLSGLSYISCSQRQLDILIAEWSSEVINDAVGISGVSAWYKLCDADMAKTSPG